MQKGFQKKLSFPNRDAIRAIHEGTEENHEYFCNDHIIITNVMY